jgi:hypothetical protein
MKCIIEIGSDGMICIQSFRQTSKSHSSNVLILSCNFKGCNVGITVGMDL